jgi:hypothetical protein
MKNEQLNISIFSYNIFWKIMKSNNTDLLDIGISKNKLLELKSNILNNILNVKNYYNPFIYCFQEAENYLEITNLFDKSNYDYYNGYSKPEYILTIWQKNILKKKLIIDGEFEQGRPFTIIIFKDLRFNIYFMLINIHSGHQINTLKNIFEPIQKIINTNIKNILKYIIKRIIIVGDFNRDIGSQITLLPNKFNLNINLSKFNFIPLITQNKTCCSIKGYGYNKNYDQIIDSYEQPLLIHQLNKESWYKSESSDHLGILSIIKNII